MENDTKPLISLIKNEQREYSILNAYFCLTYFRLGFCLVFVILMTICGIITMNAFYTDTSSNYNAECLSYFNYSCNICSNDYKGNEITFHGFCKNNLIVEGHNGNIIISVTGIFVVFSVILMILVILYFLTILNKCH